MNVYLRKGLRRIPLHTSFFTGACGVTSFIWWDKLGGHYYLIPWLIWTVIAFGKELIEQLPPPIGVKQVWIEFWVDSLAQAAGAALGILTVWFAIT